MPTNRGDRDRRTELAAVLAAVHELVGGDRFVGPHAVEHGVDVAAPVLGDEVLGRPADHLLLVVAEQAGRRGIPALDETGG
jgi:hypothetical protein